MSSTNANNNNASPSKFAYSITEPAGQPKKVDTKNVPDQSLLTVPDTKGGVVGKATTKQTFGTKRDKYTVSVQPPTPNPNQYGFR